MKIIEQWQYKYIEKCLYNFDKLKESHLETEKKMVQAIEQALQFFKGTSHEIMVTEFYFRATHYRKKMTPKGHYRFVCTELIFTEEATGYIIRKDVVYKIAINCYAYGIFKLENTEER